MYSITILTLIYSTMNRTNEAICSNKMCPRISNAGRNLGFQPPSATIGVDIYLFFKVPFFFLVVM